MAMRNLLVYIGRQYDPIRARDLDKLEGTGLNAITLEVGLGSDVYGRIKVQRIAAENCRVPPQF
ncbi:hypothetical protein HT747_21425 [Brevibacillus borstelensis]|uniref:hypothetical protein n=1 Tax=Brevibacillus borstelensis TaxID=45462 RepID=UPI00156252C4|nr:hypothetical protein [Brevibacillus borstelensis]MBE5397687.1 hypothetical protein [Brevibacillus borstelensis]